MKKQMLALALLLCAVFAFALCTAAAECNHNYVEQVGRVPATCTAKGSIPYTCSKCGAQKTEEIPMLEHDFVESARIPSTCTPGRLGDLQVLNVRHGKDREARGNRARLEGNLEDRANLYRGGQDKLPLLPLRRGKDRGGQGART